MTKPREIVNEGGTKTNTEKNPFDPLENQQ